MKTKSLFIFAFLLLLGASSPAFAQCEPPGVPEGAASAVDAAQASETRAMVAAVEESYKADETEALDALTDSLKKQEDTVIGRLNKFWDDFHKALQDMTEQLHGGIIDETRQVSSFNDSSDISASALALQQAQIEARKRYQPTDQACQFDTTATALGQSRGVATGVSTGYSLDFNKVGVNQKAASGATGPAALQKSRFDVYTSKFCDPKSNNGAAACKNQDPAKANMDILPSKTIFSKLTIGYLDADTREAVNQLMFNITGYQAPEPIAPGALNSTAGAEQRLTDREYAAQMDAVGALAYSVVAERTPGEARPFLYGVRRMMGITDASPTPSARELRQVLLEQLWDPNYYAGLSDNPSTTTQKEVYLKAYSLLMLYDMIEKQEKISNVYAIETANMLNKSDHSRHGAISSAPLSGNKAAPAGGTP